MERGQEIVERRSGQGPGGHGVETWKAVVRRGLPRDCKKAGHR